MPPPPSLHEAHLFPCHFFGKQASNPFLNNGNFLPGTCNPEDGGLRGGSLPLKSFEKYTGTQVAAEAYQKDTTFQTRRVFF